MSLPGPDLPDPVFQFGTVVGAHNVDDILVDLINFWSPTYLAEVARRAGEAPDELKPFRSYRVSHELEKMPEDQTPGMIIANRGIQDEPSKMGTSRPGKAYYATWRYQFGVILSAKGKKEGGLPRAQRLAKMYAVAIRLLLIQKRDDPNMKPEWEGILGMLDWVDESYDGIDSDGDRTICLAHTDFNVNVPDAAIWATGPLDPESPFEPDSPTWPPVTATYLNIIKDPTGGE